MKKTGLVPADFPKTDLHKHTDVYPFFHPNFSVSKNYPRVCGASIQNVSYQGW